MNAEMKGAAGVLVEGWPVTAGGTSCEMKETEKDGTDIVTFIRWFVLGS